MREDHDAAGLRALARPDRLGRIGRLWGTGLVRFNAEGPDCLRDHHGGGVVPRLTPAMLEALMCRIEDGPIAAVHGVARWRQADLGQWLYEDGVSLSRSRLSAVIRGLDFRLLTGRPRHHAQDPEAQDVFKKASPTS